MVIYEKIWNNLVHINKKELKMRYGFFTFCRMIFQIEDHPAFFVIGISEV